METNSPAWLPTNTPGRWVMTFLHVLLHVATPSLPAAPLPCGPHKAHPALLAPWPGLLGSPCWLVQGVVGTRAAGRTHHWVLSSGCPGTTAIPAPAWAQGWTRGAPRAAAGAGLFQHPPRRWAVTEQPVQLPYGSQPAERAALQREGWWLRIREAGKSAKWP